MCESFIHLQFISVYGVSCWLSPFLFFLSFLFFFFTYLSRSPNTICWRGCFCSILRSCLLRHMLIDRKGLSLFLGSVFCSVGLCACFYASTYELPHYPSLDVSHPPPPSIRAVEQTLLIIQNIFMLLESISYIKKKLPEECVHSDCGRYTLRWSLWFLPEGSQTFA